LKYVTMVSYLEPTLSDYEIRGSTLSLPCWNPKNY
jgi:hypothetical protein